MAKSHSHDQKRGAKAAEPFSALPPATEKIFLIRTPSRQYTESLYVIKLTALPISCRIVSGFSVQF